MASPQSSSVLSQLPPTPPSEATNLDTTKMTSNPTSNATGAQPAQETKHIWVITGPAGCGKTSVAEHLHATHGLPYLEGDTVRPP